MNHRPPRRLHARLLSINAVCAYTMILAALLVTVESREISMLAAACIIALSLIYSWWGWRGRSDLARDWASQGILSHRLTLGIFPGTGLIFSSIAALGADLPTWIKGLAMPILFVGVLVFVVGGLIGPRWWGPSWFRGRG